jgi:hypothetical protein
MYRVRELEMNATEATLLRVRAMSPTLGQRPPKAPMDVISNDSQGTFLLFTLYKTQAGRSTKRQVYEQNTHGSR